MNGVSVLNQGVANVPVASTSNFGAVKIFDNYGIKMHPSNGQIMTNKADSSQLKAGATNYNPVVPANQHESTFYGLAKAAGADMARSSNPVGTYTDAAKSAISTMLNGPVTVSGTTPSITALPGIQYVCGEVSTLDITLPARTDSTRAVWMLTPPTKSIL